MARLSYHVSTLTRTPPLPLPPPSWGLDDPLPADLPWPDDGRESSLRGLRLVLKALRPRPRPLAKIKSRGEIIIEVEPDPWLEDVVAAETEAA